MGKKDVLNEFMHAENLTTTELASIFQRRTGVVSSMKTRGLSKNYAKKLKELYPKYSLQWLLTGEGNMYDHTEGSNIIKCTGNATHNTQTSAGLYLMNWSSSAKCSRDK